MKRFRAFTLIEVLVVVAIIALLVAILIPSLSAARMSARRSQSASNMRQIGIAMQMYTQDHKGHMPFSTHANAAWKSWIFTLAGGKNPATGKRSSRYLGGVDEVRICPADPKARERLENQGTSYTLNEYVVVPKVDPFGNVVEDFTNAHRWKFPTRTVTTFILADHRGYGPTEDHTHSRNWFPPYAGVTWDKVRRDIQVDRFRTGRYADDNTKGSTLLLYGDTHVETVNAKSLKDRCDTGFDFAKPPQ